MAAPFNATWRIVIPYTTDGLLHNTKVFVRNGQVSGSTYNINSRPVDANDIDWVDAADNLALLLNPILPTATSYGTALLQELVSLTWITRATHALTDATAGGGILKAEQDTVVLRDRNFFKVKFQVMEGVFGSPLHYTDVNAPGGAATTFLKQFTPAFTLAVAPYSYMVGRDDVFLADSPFVGFTSTLNRKLRRRRGLA